MKRYKPPATAQAELLIEWDNRCAYCRLPFGLLVWYRSSSLPREGAKLSYRGTFNARRHAAIILHLEWDHFIPFTYSDSNIAGQFLPACQLCNALKGARMFRSIDGVREYLEPRWLKRYELASGPAGSWEAARLSDASDYAE